MWQVTCEKGQKYSFFKNYTGNVCDEKKVNLSVTMEVGKCSILPLHLAIQIIESTYSFYEKENFGEQEIRKRIVETIINSKNQNYSLKLIQDCN